MHPAVGPAGLKHGNVLTDFKGKSAPFFNKMVEATLYRAHAAPPIFLIFINAAMLSGGTRG